MISVAQAQKSVIDNAALLPKLKVELSASSNQFLAQDIIAPLSLPPFRQSAMDGYAFIYDENCTSLKVVGKVQAGAAEVPKLKKEKPFEFLREQRFLQKQIRLSFKSTHNLNAINFS